MKERSELRKAPVEWGDQKSSESHQEEEERLTFPTSITQRQFWLLNQLAPDSPAYNIPSVFHITGCLDLSALSYSLNEIIRRHEIFRTIFSTEKGEPVQIISPQVRIDLPVISLARHSKNKLDQEVLKLVQAEVTLPFDLHKGPLIRAKLLCLADVEYVFILVMHHIITDLQTTNHFFRELSTLYDAFVTGRPYPLENPPRHYSDYAVWQHEWRKGEKVSSMLSYWRRQLEKQSGFLSLPTDRQRPAVPSLRGSTQHLELSRDLTDGLKQLSRKELVSPYITLLSAYLVLLHRYSGQFDITVGIPFTNRRQSKFEDVMGCFVNILPLSVHLSDDPSFREVIHRVRKAMLSAHRHQEVTFELIVEELKLKRDLSYNPLYQVGFTFNPPVEVELRGVAVKPLISHNESAKVDIFASLWNAGEGIRGVIEYNTDIFDDETIERFVGNYRALLEAITKDADQQISSLMILTKAEVKQLLVNWCATDTICSEDSGIHQLVERQAEQTPDEVAVVFEGSQLTYRELNQRANQLAHFLRGFGVGPEVLVGIYMERSADMLIALLGILKAGGAYVPLDPDFPRERVTYMLEHSDVSAVLSEQRLKIQLPDNKAQIICLDSDWKDISRKSKENPVNKNLPDNLAYVIYTSGSTGKPKGVEISHRAAVNFLDSMRREPGFTKQDVLLAVTTLCFDISVLELFLPLSVGAKVVIANRDVALDGRQLIEVLRTSEVTVMQATPATWRLLIASDWKGSGSLKVLCGGEPMPTDLAHELIGRSASAWNMYGPTETTVWSTCYHLTDLEAPILIGRPIANTQIYILDRRMQVLPVGVPGEIYIGGAGLARGYLKQPEMTAERFVPHPFSKDPSARLYKTGDLGRYLRDGNIEYLCRIDNQVKVRGFRIELGEIEAILMQHAELREVAVAAREDTHGNATLVAYVVPGEGKKPTVESLRTFLQAKLPHYMVPATFVTLKALPLTPNGKVDRKALPEPPKTRPEMEQAYVFPSTACERSLTDIWCQVLGLNQIGVYDNFFDLGGNSLLAVQVIERVKQTLENDISVIKLFQYPTIRLFAKHLNRKQSDQPSYQKILDRAKRRKEAFSRRKLSTHRA